MLAFEPELWVLDVNLDAGFGGAVASHGLGVVIAGEDLLAAQLIGIPFILFNGGQVELADIQLAGVGEGFADMNLVHFFMRFCAAGWW